MNKTELENAIKNGESVWYIFGKSNKIIKVDTDRIDFLDNGIVRFSYENLGEIKGYQQYLSIDGKTKCFFKTKAEAEHYLHHANVVRTEELPFLTWEEFASDIMAFNSFSFITEDGYRASLMYDKATRLIILDSGKEIKTYDATEANFYKAYDECVRLFKQEQL